MNNSSISLCFYKFPHTGIYTMDSRQIQQILETFFFSLSALYFSKTIQTTKNIQIKKTHNGEPFYSHIQFICFCLATQPKYIWELKKTKYSRARVLPIPLLFYIFHILSLIISVCQKNFPINQKVFWIPFPLNHPTRRSSTLKLMLTLRLRPTANKQKMITIHENS